MAYALNFLLVGLYIFIFKTARLPEKKKYVCFLLLCSIQFTLLVGTRALETGADTRNYYYIFNSIIRLDNPFTVARRSAEPLYRMLCWVVGKMGLGFVWLNLIVAAITMFFLSAAIYKFHCNAYYSIFLFLSFCLFYQMQNQYRQIAAISIAFYGCACLLENSNFGGRQFVFWVVLAAGFHYSVLIMLPMIFLKNVRITRKIMIVYVIATVLMITGFQLVMRLIASSYYAGYLMSSYNEKGQTSTLLNLVVRIVLLLFCTYFHENVVKARENIDFFYHMAIICTILQLLTTYSALFGRVTTYFFVGYLVLIPEIAQNGFRRPANRRILNGTLFFIFMLWHYVYFINTGGYAYKSFLFRLF